MLKTMFNLPKISGSRSIGTDLSGKKVNKRRTKKISAIPIVIALAFLMMSAEVYADTVILRPNAAGSETNIGYQYPESGEHWDKVDEETADDGSTYIAPTVATSYSQDLYALPNPSLSGTINKITIYFRIQGVGYYMHKAKPLLKTYGTTYYGVEVNLGDDASPWANHSQEWTTNPSTTSAWTWDEINALEIGIALYKYYAGITQCTQVYVEIEYTSPAYPPNAPTSLKCESVTNPSAVGDNTPEFKATITDDNDGDIITHVEVQVGTDNDWTAAEMWSSGWIDVTDFVEGSESPEVSYAGTALSDLTEYWWRIRGKDDGGELGSWSTEVAHFTTNFGNTVPSASVDTPTGVQSGDVTISYTLTDPNSNLIYIIVEYSDDGGSHWLDPTMGTGGQGTTGLSSSPGGTSHTYVWNSSADIGTKQDDIRIRITPYDAGGEGTAGETNNFTVDNLPSNAVTIGDICNTTTITVPIMVHNVAEADGICTFTVFLDYYDEDDPDAQITCKATAITQGDIPNFTPNLYYADPTDGGWIAATGFFVYDQSVHGDVTLCYVTFDVIGVPGNCTVLDIYYYDVYHDEYFWSDVMLSRMDGTAIPHTVIDGTFHIGNGPPMAMVTTPTGSQTGDIAINYRLVDPGYETVDITVKFSNNSGSTWNNATMAGGDGINSLATSSSGVPHTYIWDSVADIGTAGQGDIRIKIIPTDGVAGETDDFAVNAPAITSVTTPSGTQTCDVSIEYTVSDPQSDNVDIAVQWAYYRVNHWEWHDATMGTGGDGTTNLSTTPTGVSHTYVWDSKADAGFVENESFRIKITPSDPAVGLAGESFAFTVDNHAYVNGTSGTDDASHGLGPGSDAFKTIQYAIDQDSEISPHFFPRGSPRGVIYVEPGTYTENINVDKKLTLQSTQGPGSTIIQASNPNSNVITIDGGTHLYYLHAYIWGFRITGATNAAGIYIHELQAAMSKISHNIMTGNKYGVHLYNQAESYAHCKVNYNNIYGNSDYGAYCTYGSAFNIEYNWWGDDAPSDDIGYGTGGSSADYTPWLDASVNDFKEVNTQTETNIGPSGGQVKVTITSTPDDENYLSVYQVGSLSDDPVTTGETFPTGFDKRSNIVWGIVETQHPEGGVTANLVFDYSNQPGIVNASTIEILKRSNAQDGSWALVTESSRDDVAKTITLTGVTSFSEYALGAGSDNPLSAYVYGAFKVWLEGAYDTGTDLMRIDIHANIPLTSPYTEAPKTVGSIPADVVDWVWVQLRSTESGATEAQRSLFMKKDGNVVDTDGTTTGIPFEVAAGEYYVIVRHRNHLGIMSATKLTFVSSGGTNVHNFTTASSQSYGTDAVKELETGVYGMYSGEGNNSGIVSIADVTIAIDNRDAVGYEASDYNLSNIVTVADATNSLANRDKNSKIPSQ